MASPPPPQTREYDPSIMSSAGSFVTTRASTVNPRISSRGSLLAGAPEDADYEDEDSASLSSADTRRPSVAGRSASPASDKPPLPARPKRDISKGIPRLQISIPQKFGLDRVRGEEFEASDSPAVGRHGFRNFSKSDVNLATEAQEDTRKTSKFLINQRKLANERSLANLDPEELRNSTEEYFEEVHARDGYIELLSEIGSDNYEYEDTTMLYDVVTGSLKVSNRMNDVETDEAVESSVEMLKNVGCKEEEVNALNDKLSKILTVLREARATPLDALIATRIKSIKTCLILCSSMKTCIFDNPQKFQFLLLRSIESKDPKYVVDAVQSGAITFAKIDELLRSDEFWVRVFKNVESAGLVDTLIRNCVIYGFYSLVDILAFSIMRSDEKPSSVDVVSDLCRFDREYTIINRDADVYSSDAVIAKEREKFQFYTHDLQEKKTKYTDLLHNYKQLNEERFSNDASLSRLSVENGKLKLEHDARQKELADKLSSFDVIKINNDKNDEIRKLNASLRAEIKKLTEEIADLDAGMK